MIAIRAISRFKAASAHLLISAVIAAATLTLMLALWYPPGLFSAMGGMELAILIVGIDVAIGPLLTLIVFDTRKKNLLLDLAAIAILQLAALSYGIFAMHAGRPVFMVATDTSLAIVTANEIEPEELAKTPREEFRHLSLTGPQLVAAIPPTDSEELSNIAFAAFGGGGIQHFPKYYVPYGDARAQTIAASRPLTDLNPGDEDKARLDRYLQRSGRQATALRCLPVKARRGLLTAILSAQGDLLEILDIHPTLRN